MEHVNFCSDKCYKCSENVRCPTIISGSERQTGEEGEREKAKRERGRQAKSERQAKNGK